jgi:beta-galactosidase
MVRVSTDEDELPPVIWADEPGDKGFFIGYSVDRSDYLYEVQYGTKPGQYDHHIGLRNVGVLKIPGLENGVEYFYRLRSRRQWGFASEWSQEFSVKPDGGIPPLAPDVAGALQKGKDLLICLNPSKKATGYKVNVYANDETVETRRIDRGLTQFLLLENLNSAKIRSLDISSMNDNGFSEAVQIKNIVR